MKLLLAFILSCTAGLVFSQGMVEGQLLDPSTNQPVQFAHIENIRNHTGTIGSAKGYFQLPARLGDTIVFSSVGYQRLGWIVDKDWLSHGKTLNLPQDTTMLDEIVINQLPPEAIFKQRILNYQPEDSSFWYHGMPQPKPYDNRPLSEQVINNPLFAITHPTDFLYEKFSRSAKEKRKYQKITEQQFQQQRAYQKLNRDWIEDVTSLHGDELTSFIAFCDFSIAYIEKTPLYIIREEMLAKLSEFKKEQKG